MPARIFSCVFSPKPSRAATFPSLQACSSAATEVTPSSRRSAAIFFGPRPGNLQHLDQAGLDRGLELVEEFQPPRGVQFGDLGRQGLADALDALKPVLGDKLLELVVLQGLDRPGAGRIGADLERVFTLQLHQRPDLDQHVRDLVLRHLGISDGQAGEFNAGRAGSRRPVEFRSDLIPHLGRRRAVVKGRQVGAKCLMRLGV